MFVWRLSAGVFRLSCSLLISVVCIPVLPRPRRLKGLFRSPLSWGLFTKYQDLFLTTWSDNIPYMLHLLHLQLSEPPVTSTSGGAMNHQSSFLNSALCLSPFSSALSGPLFLFKRWHPPLFRLQLLFLSALPFTI